MSSWNLKLRSLLGSRRQQSKARRPRTTVRPRLEVLEDRTLPSASPTDAQPISYTASPQAAPAVANITLDVRAMIDQRVEQFVTFEQDLVSIVSAEYQVIYQEVVSLQTQVARIFGFNLNPANSSLAATATQPSGDSGSGRGNSSGAGSGSSATTTAHNTQSQQLNNSTQKTGSGSGSGSSMTTTHARVAKNALARVRPLTSGTGSGPATVYGNVWLDSDYDGSPDNGELGYYGASVNLDVVNPSTGSIEGGFGTQTDSSGNYNFTITEDPVGHYYEIQVVFPWSFFATKPGYSQIDAQGYTAMFQLAAGDVVQKNAGIASMNVDITQDDANNQKIQNKVTLRDAIQTGNDGPPQPAVTFYSAPNTALSGTISLQAALDPIKTSYDIVGPGASTLTVNGNNNAGTIFTVNAGVTSTIRGLTITGGNGGNGGGIFNQGDLTLYADVIVNNQSTGNGGGVYNDSGAQLSLQTVTLGTVGNPNSATQGGGGLYNLGTVTICCGSVIIGNAAGKGGGGIYNSQGTVQVFDDTQINGNTDGGLWGGGVYNKQGKFEMYGGYIADNKETSSHGGGAYNYFGTMTLTGVAVLGNRAIGYGGGIYTYEGSLTLTITLVRKIRKQGRDRIKVRKGGRYHGNFLTRHSAAARSGSGGVASARPARL